MENRIKLHINTPCSENFDLFKTTENGGYCGSCKKEVIDFTKFKPQEIAAYFKINDNTNTCGKFNRNQLKAYENQPQRINKFSFLSGFGLACLSLFSFNVAQAQETPDNGSSKMVSQNQEKNILVKGYVSESSLPLPGVNIILEGSSSGTQTDFNGNFEFPEKLKKGDVLVFSFVGMTSKKIVITDEETASKIELKIDMDATTCVLLGKVAVKKIYKSKRK